MVEAAADGVGAAGIGYGYASVALELAEAGVVLGTLDAEVEEVGEVATGAELLEELGGLELTGMLESKGTEVGTVS